MHDTVPTKQCVLILGASGNFGRIIAKRLAQAEITLILAARRMKPLQNLQQQLKKSYQNTTITCQTVQADYQSLKNILSKQHVLLLINASGPFQACSYDVAKACIDTQTHYVDLSDGREYVCGIKTLDQAAREARVSIISGASTVPALSSAVIESAQHNFASISAMRYGIATGAKTPRGLATTKAILSYIGRPIITQSNVGKKKYGWQDTYRQTYPEIGARWMGNCDIPDLDLFPGHYHIKNINFSAGMQSSILHFGIYACSWLIRICPVINLGKFAKPLLKFSHLFDCCGNHDGGMHIILSGQDKQGKRLEYSWYIIAKQGDGINIPTIPAIYIAKQISNGHLFAAGAYPCLGVIPLSAYLQELSGYEIKTVDKLSYKP